MSNPETPYNPDTPNFDGIEPESLQYLQDLSDAFERLPEELKNRQAAYAGNLRLRKDAIAQAIEIIEHPFTEIYKKIRSHGLRVQESNTRLAFEQYIDVLFLLHEDKRGNRARALEAALRSADESQSELNERAIGFKHHFDPTLLREMVDEIVELPDTIEAAARACAVYDNLVKPVDNLFEQLAIERDAP